MARAAARNPPRGNASRLGASLPRCSKSRSSSEYTLAAAYTAPIAITVRTAAAIRWDGASRSSSRCLTATPVNTVPARSQSTRPCGSRPR